MISIIDTPTTDRSAVSTCLLGSRLRGTGLSGAGIVDAVSFGFACNGGSERLLGDERPAKAPAVAVVAQAAAYALDAAANGAGGERQKKQHPMWAFRGHEPWRDPA